MKKVLYFRAVGRDVHIPKLVGAFVLVAALLMFVQGSAKMFDSWDQMKFYGTCITGIDSSAALDEQRAEFAYCSDVLYKSTGVVIREDHPRLTTRQFWTGLLPPIANVFFWLAALFIGYLFYRTDGATLPFQASFSRPDAVAAKPKKFVFRKK